VFGGGDADRDVVVADQIGDLAAGETVLLQFPAVLSAVAIEEEQGGARSFRRGRESVRIVLFERDLAESRGPDENHGSYLNNHRHGLPTRLDFRGMWAIAVLVAQADEAGAGLKWTALVLAGAGDPVHVTAQQINQYAVGVEARTGLAASWDVFGEFDVTFNAPVNRGESFVLLNFFVGLRGRLWEQGPHLMGGLGQSWNNNDEDRFAIKQVQTHWNWGLHAGVGWRFESGPVVEIRFSHWSNGHFTGDRNFGYNALLLVVGYQFN
jgi:hypothetical protein